MQKILAIVCILLFTCQISNGYDYDEYKANQMTWLSVASYCIPENVRFWDCGQACDQGPNLIDIQYMAYDVNFGFIGYNKLENSINIVFRGTMPTNLKNWFDDLKLLYTSYPHCYQCSVHYGFQESYERLQDQFRYIMGEYYLKKYPSAQIQVTGHSLGGALAILAVADLYNYFKIKVDLLVTQGMPRTGNENFAKWFDMYVAPKKNFRVTYYADPVPDVPFGFGYTHIGQNIEYSRFKNSYKMCDQSCRQNRVIIWNPFNHGKYFEIDFLKNFLSKKCGTLTFNPQKIKPSFMMP